MKKIYIATTIVCLASAGILQGCAAGLAVPALAGTNLIKNGPIVLVVEGKGDGIAAFKLAVIGSGGTVPRQTQDYAEGNYSARAVKAEIQGLGGGRFNVTITPTAAKSWDFVDTIQQTADAIADGMGKQGFAVTSRTREGGL
jgi:hypothetical protein